MPKRILIIGSGFAGTWSALAAKRLINFMRQGTKTTDPIEIVVIAPEPRLVIRPRLYEANPGNMSAPLTELFQATGIRFIQGTVESICTAQREVEITDSTTGARSAVSYDRLILAAGSRLAHLDSDAARSVPGVREHAFNVDQVKDAERLETHLQALQARPYSAARDTVVVCGAGFTGIEVATELATHLKSTTSDDSLKKPDPVRVVLVGREPEVGPDLGPGPRPVITQALRDLGVEVKLGAGIVRVDAAGVTLSSGERIETLTPVWTAGVVASPLARQIEGERDGLGRLHVDRNLRVPTSPDVFVAGDAAYASTGDEAGHFALMSCQHALFLGRAAGHNAAADLLDIALRPYTQLYYGTCLDLGGFGAVVSVGWDRDVMYQGAAAKKIKQYINGVLVYPPAAEDPERALADANPDFEYTMDELAALVGVA